MRVPAALGLIWSTFLLLEQRFLIIASLSLLGLSASGQEVTSYRPPLPQQEQERIAHEVLQHPDLKPLAAQGPVRVLSVNSYPPAKKGDPTVAANAATIIIFSYGEGRAYRVLYEPGAKRILGRELLPGRPQPSAEERTDVYNLIRADAAHAKLLAAGDVLEGGFAVDGPPGSSDRDRFVQVHVLSPDRKNFVRVVTVDLSTTKIVSSVPKE